MAITIDWSTFVINVPKADTVLVQSYPAEIRQLDLDEFRLILKDIEDSEEGMSFTKTHTHNTEVSLGGLTYARIIEILDPYTITFEDGPWAVNLIGANSNVGDKVNFNQVSVRTNNAAGLISSPLIEFASYGNSITIDEVNGTDSAIFPFGTPASPCKTLLNARDIAIARGFKTINVIGDLTFAFVPAGVLVDYIFIGNGRRSSTLTISNVEFTNCYFKNCTLQGTFSNSSYVDATDCTIKNLYNITLHAHDCDLSGVIELNELTNNICSFVSCYDGVPGSSTPIIQVNDCAALNIWQYSGGISVTNVTTSGAQILIDLNSGRLFVDSSDTEGDIIVSGVGKVYGTTGGTIIDSVSLLDNESIAEYVSDSISINISGGIPPTVEEIRQEMDNNSTKLAQIKALATLIPATI